MLGLSLGGRDWGWDWLVVAGYLGLTTLLGAKLAGKQASIRDFFLAGRKLPWWAICGSIIATEVSVATFIAVPVITFAANGDFTYLQFAIGTIIARIIIGYAFVPRFYEQEIYSPYDYMGNRLGPRVKKATTLLFFVGAVLGQGARVYLTAFVVGAVSGLDLVTSIWVIGAFSVCWTLLGGMTTVIWTDVIQFGVLVIGAVIMLCCAVAAVPGGAGEIVRAGIEAGKFRLLDFSTDPSARYTLWCGLLAMPFLNLAAFGTDQVMAQRMFCSRNERDARRAIIASSVSVGVAVLMLAVGVALWVYFDARHNPLAPREARLYGENANYLVPIFIVRELPAGVRGLIIAALFAAAISTLDSALAALSQTTLSLFARRRATDAGATAQCGTGVSPVRGDTGETPVSHGWSRRLSDITLSRLLVVAWGAALSLMAIACIRIARQYPNAIDLVLALVGYTYGPLLGIFLLALFPTRRDDRGLLWAVPMAMLAVFGMSQHGLHTSRLGIPPTVDIADWVVWIGAGLCVLLGVLRLWRSPARVTAVVAAAALVVWLHHYQAGVSEKGAATYLAYPWSFPIGTLLTFVLGYCLGRSKGANESDRGTGGEGLEVRGEGRGEALSSPPAATAH